MRLCLDARNTGRPGGTGIASYARTLATALADGGVEIAWLLENASDPRNSANTALRRFGRALAPAARAASPLSPTASDYLCRDVYRAAHVRFGLFGRSQVIKAMRPPDLMHWTCPLPLRMAGCPNVVTIHDLIPMLHPELCDTDPARFERLVRRSIHDAHAVIAISETVRADILRAFDVPPDRVRVVLQGVAMSPALLRESRAVAPPCPPGAFVHAGSIEPRKNIGRLIRAHGRSRTARPLVLIGPDGHGAAGELAALDSHPRPDLVRRIPWIERPRLIRAIADARALVFPSLAEGFGLPIVEAMLLDTPVLTARHGATGEIAADAACLVDATDEDAIAYGLRQLDTDDDLCDALAARGRSRSSAFDLARYSSRMQAFYADVMRDAAAFR